MTFNDTVTRIVIPKPFANNLQSLTIVEEEGDVVNYPQGFSSVYGAPASSGGKYVNRDDINSIGKIATNDLFYHKCGGVNSFDKAFATKVGGYPMGAVLDYVVGNTLNKVLSLVDNNEFDYTTGGVDGVHWQIMNVPVSESIAPGWQALSIVNPMPMYDVSAASTYPIIAGTFTAPFNGVVTTRFDGTRKYASDHGSESYLRGILVAVATVTNGVVPNLPSIDNIDSSTDWTVVYNDGLNVGNTRYGTVKTLNVTKGTKYAVASVVCGSNGSSQYTPDSFDISAINLYIS